MVSVASHAPFANSLKSTQAFALRFMYATSMTLSGAREVLAACAEASDGSAKATTRNTRLIIGRRRWALGDGRWAMGVRYREYECWETACHSEHCLVIPSAALSFRA